MKKFVLLFTVIVMVTSMYSLATVSAEDTPIPAADMYHYETLQNFEDCYTAEDVISMAYGPVEYEYDLSENIKKDGTTSVVRKIGANTKYQHHITSVLFDEPMDLSGTDGIGIWISNPNNKEIPFHIEIVGSPLRWTFLSGKYIILEDGAENAVYANLEDTYCYVPANFSGYLYFLYEEFQKYSESEQTQKGEMDVESEYYVSMFIQGVAPQDGETSVYFDDIHSFKIGAPEPTPTTAPATATPIPSPTPSVTATVKPTADAPLKTISPASSDGENEDGGNTTLIVIIVIAAAVIVGAAIVFIIIKKKK